MARELKAYRDNLEDILSFTGGKRLMTLKEAGQYLGRDWRWVKKYIPNADNVVAAPTLARRLSEGY